MPSPSSPPLFPARSWFPTGKLVFVAPTKPLVEQQRRAFAEHAPCVASVRARANHIHIHTRTRTRTRAYTPGCTCARADAQTCYGLAIGDVLRGLAEHVSLGARRMECAAKSPGRVAADRRRRMCCERQRPLNARLAAGEGLSSLFFLQADVVVLSASRGKALAGGGGAMGRGALACGGGGGGSAAAEARRGLWATKRVFFCTPQVPRAVPCCAGLRCAGRASRCAGSMHNPWSPSSLPSCQLASPQILQNDVDCGACPRDQ
jgi:hypothetical protein